MRQELAKLSWIRGAALRGALWLIVAGWAVALASGPARAERKVALVIGNAAYQHTRALPNPKNDAEAIAALLRTIGFAEDDVSLKVDLDYGAMREAIRAFVDKVVGADVALVYYAGHGIEGGGQNYLLPVDAKLARGEIDLEYEAITLSSVLAAVDTARKLKLVILDACRNNPLSDKLPVPAGAGTREWTRGLRAVETKGDMLVAYAAKAGTVALDGSGRHSPFAEALLKHMPTPGLDVYRMFGKVAETVLETTGRKQEPHVYGRPGGEPVTLVSAAIPLSPAPKTPVGLLELPPEPPKRPAKAGEKPVAEPSAEVFRICREVEGMKSLAMLRALADEHNDSTGARRCIAVRIEELSKEAAAPDKAKAAEAAGEGKARETGEKAKDTGKPIASAELPRPADPSSPTAAPPPKPDAGPKVESSSKAAPEAVTEAAPKATPKAADVPRTNWSDGGTSGKLYDPPSPTLPAGPFAPAASAPATECDRLAASADTPPHLGVKAIPLALVDAVRAIPACQDAVARYPADPRLQGLLGRALHKAGRYGEARAWYEKAIEKGDALALHNLAGMYENAQGVPTDHAKALSLYHRAAEAGHTFSLRNIGRMYEYGGGVAQSYAVALSWYEKAVQKGEPAGMHEIGRLYLEGKGVPQDFAIARSWFEKAAAKDYAPSMTSLGWLYETGRGGPQDAGYARSWYEKGVAGGNATAAYNLAQLLARGGLGVGRDAQAAARHLLAAARAGNPTARGDLDGTMTLWDAEVRRALQGILAASGDYRGGIGGDWWGPDSSNAAKAYYMRGP